MSLLPLLPAWVLALTVLPLLGLTVWQATRQSGRLAGGAGPADGAGRLAWWRRTAIVVVLAGIGLGPAVPDPQGRVLLRSIDVFFVVDRTGSMAAEDFDGGAPRLDGVRHDIVAIAEAIPSARYSVISFDSQASRQLPLTTDTHAIESWADTFDRELTAYSRGSLTDRPLEPLREALAGAHEQNPQNVRVVFFMTDGEQTADGTPQSYNDLKPMIEGGAVLGYGTSEGGQMKENDPSVDPGPGPSQGPGSSPGAGSAAYIQDPATGKPAVSKLNEKALTELADQLGVAYVHRDAPTDVTEIVRGIDGHLVAAQGGQERPAWRVIAWPLSLVLAALLGWETWSWASTTKRSRRRR